MCEEIGTETDDTFVLVRKHTFLEFVSASRQHGVDTQCRRRSASGPPAPVAWTDLRTVKVQETSELSTSSLPAEQCNSIALARVTAPTCALPLVEVLPTWADMKAAAPQQKERLTAPDTSKIISTSVFRHCTSLSNASTDAGADSDRKSEASSDEIDISMCCTLMLGNLPNNYTRDMLLELIDLHGFVGQYDFFYLPMDFNTKASLGYAFINFVSAAQAQYFWACFDGFSQWSMPTKKKCKVQWSHPLQGLEANIERYRNSPVMHQSVPDEYKPVKFEMGVRVPMPPPTKSIKVPRVKSWKTSYHRRFH